VDNPSCSWTQRSLRISALSCEVGESMPVKWARAMPSGSRPRRSLISITTTALDRVSGAVCGDACVPGFGCGLARESVGGLVLSIEVVLRGFGFVWFVCLSRVSGSPRCF